MKNTLLYKILNWENQFIIRCLIGLIIFMIITWLRGGEFTILNIFFSIPPIIFGVIVYDQIIRKKFIKKP